MTGPSPIILQSGNFYKL